ncbi:MAG: hypothetical protein AAF497_10760 [Planctomycetota bacterium]
MNSPRLKVLHFTTTVGGGGAEQMLCNVVEAMNRKGIQSVVVSTTSSDGDNSLYLAGLAAHVLSGPSPSSYSQKRVDEPIHASSVAGRMVCAKGAP